MAFLSQRKAIPGAEKEAAVNRPNIVETRYLTANEAAVFLGVAVGTLRNLVSGFMFPTERDY
jgi:hypothetical protein